MQTSGKKLFSIWEVYRIMTLAFRSIPLLKRAKTAGKMDKAFLERIMLAVTEVNGCAACSYYHTKVALEEGFSAEEIRDTILALYDRGLADPHFFEPEYTEEQLRPGVLPAHEARSLDRLIETAWEKVRRWYYFAPERAQAITRAAEIAVSEPPAAPLPAAERKPWTPPVPFRAPPKTGRNDPCPCGSGKKFKKCCGK